MNEIKFNKKTRNVFNRSKLSNMQYKMIQWCFNINLNKTQASLEACYIKGLIRTSQPNK